MYACVCGSNASFGCSIWSLTDTLLTRSYTNNVVHVDSRRHADHMTSLYKTYTRRPLPLTRSSKICGQKVNEKIWDK